MTATHYLLAALAVMVVALAIVRIAVASDRRHARICANRLDTAIRRAAATRRIARANTWEKSNVEN